MNILAIDPGLTPGYCILNPAGEVIISGFFETEPELPMAARLTKIWEDILFLFYQLSDGNKKFYVAIEDVTVVRPPKGKFNNHNFATPGIYTLVLMETYSRHIKLYTLTPSEVKKAFTGDGKAKKPKVRAKAREYVPGVKNYNEADAIGIAVTALGVIQNEQRNNTSANTP